MEFSNNKRVLGFSKVFRAVLQDQMLVRRRTTTRRPYDQCNIVPEYVVYVLRTPIRTEHLLNISYKLYRYKQVQEYRIFNYFKRNQANLNSTRKRREDIDIPMYNDIKNDRNKKRITKIKKYLNIYIDFG